MKKIVADYSAAELLQKKQHAEQSLEQLETSIETMSYDELTQFSSTVMKLSELAVKSPQPTLMAISYLYMSTMRELAEQLLEKKISEPADGPATLQ